VPAVVAGGALGVAVVDAAGAAVVVALTAGAGVGVPGFALVAGVVGAALPAFALAPAAGTVLPLSALLAGVCARAAGRIEINPANAVNQKALLRRITTLSRLRIARDFVLP